MDRFVDSSLAYQGAGRDLPIEQIAQINRFATGPLQADRTLLLDLPAALGRRRKLGQAPDRLEREGEDFFETIARAYRDLAADDPRRIRTIDARAAAREVLAAALDALEDILPAPSPD
jgi:dTMP kinase